MTDCLLTERGQGNVSNFYILDFVATASRWFTDDINELIDARLVNLTYDVRAPVPDVSCARPPRCRSIVHRRPTGWPGDSECRTQARRSQTPPDKSPPPDTRLLDRSVSPQNQ